MHANRENANAREENASRVGQGRNRDGCWERERKRGSRFGGIAGQSRRNLCRKSSDGRRGTDGSGGGARRFVQQRCLCDHAYCANEQDGHTEGRGTLAVGRRTSAAGGGGRR